MQIKKTLIGTIAIAIAGLALWQGILGFMNEPQRDSAGEITDSGQIDAFSIRKGDCLKNLNSNQNEPTEFSELTAVPCSEPHEREVFAEMSTVFKDFDAEELDSEAVTFCNKAFEEFIGLRYEDSKYTYTYFVPTYDSWIRENDRKIQCLVGLEDFAFISGTLEGSMQ